MGLPSSSADETLHRPALNLIHFSEMPVASAVAFVSLFVDQFAGAAVADVELRPVGKLPGGQADIAGCVWHRRLG
jgi:hypothetical protein